MPENEPEPTLAIPDRPACLKGEAAAKWDELTAELFDLGLLTTIDGEQLAIYCLAWADWLECVEDLRERGKRIKAGNGQECLNPSWKIKADAERTIYRISGLFGCDPSSRARLFGDTGGGKPPGDPLGDFAGRGRKNKGNEPEYDEG